MHVGNTKTMYRITLALGIILSALVTFSHTAATERIADHEAQIVSRRNGAKLSNIPEVELRSSFWNKKAKEQVRAKAALPLNTNRAKNAILFLGDGMSIPTLAAARIYMGQLHGELGENSALSFEEFPVAGLSKTYCVDHQVADSACTATAYLGGVKTNNGIIGVTANVTRGQCEGQNYEGNIVESIALRALRAGKEAGIVTTTKLTDASPAGAYAHIAERGWEADVDLPAGEDPEKCWDISRQLILREPGCDFKVILGGGMEDFLPQSNGGRRLDGLNLVDTWRKDKEQKGVNGKFVTNKKDLEAAMESNPDFLFGTFQNGDMDYHLLADETQPTLEEMTEAAIKILSKSEDGYFLFVEGGRIDHGHHAAKAHLALDETVEFSKTIARAASLTDPDDTLIVVTSDHAHVMAFSGYPTRGNDILGFNDVDTASDSLPFLTLGYANGPGYRAEVDGKRVDISKESNAGNKDPNFRYQSMVPRSSESHGGDDVGIFARGPWQHLFTGTIEQNMISHGMAYALCLDDDYADHCDFNDVLLK